LSSLAFSDGDPPHVFPLSILLELRVLIFLIVFKLGFLSFFVVGDGDQPPFFPLSTLFELKVVKSFVIFFLSTILAIAIDAPPFL
jgi:hypothetical protein